MVCTNGEGEVDVALQIIKGLMWQGKDEIHRNRFKGNSRKGCGDPLGINTLSAEDTLVFVAKGLYADADLGHARILQYAEYFGCEIVGVKFKTYSLGDNEMLADSIDYFLYPFMSEGGCTAAKIKACDLLFFLMLTADEMYLADQGIDISVAKLLVVPYLAVGTKAADVLAKRNMNVKPEAVTFRKGKKLVIFVFEDKWLRRSRKPHSRKIC